MGQTAMRQRAAQKSVDGYANGGTEEQRCQRQSRNRLSTAMLPFRCAGHNPAASPPKAAVQARKRTMSAYPARPVIRPNA